MNRVGFLENHSRYYSKESIALITLNNGDIIFRSGMPISEYEMLDIAGKAMADAKDKFKKFKNINQRLLDGLNEEQKLIYLRLFGNPNSSSMGTFGIFACVFTLLITSLIFQSPSFWGCRLWLNFTMVNSGQDYINIYQTLCLITLWSLSFY